MPDYFVVAKKQGSANELRFFHSFGAAPSVEDALYRVQMQYLRDPAFRSRWAGWTFGALRGDFFFKINAEGASVLRVNDREDMKL